MLLGIGPGVPNLQDYTQYTDSMDSANAVQITNVQGDPLDTVKLTVRDLTSTFSIADEDDLVILDETDSHGWPTVNLLANPSFEGSYDGSGRAPSWGNPSTNKTAGTATASKSSTARYGSASQQLALSNIVNGGSGGFYELGQTVTLPVNETLQPLVTLPYVWSIFYRVTAAFTNAQLILAIDWHDVSGGYLTTSAALWATNPGVSAGWLRASLTVTAPSNAASAFVYLQYAGTATTNSGTFLQDGAQFERATFARSRVTANYAKPLINPNMVDTQVGASIVDNWSAHNSAAQVALSIVSSPAFASATAQQVAFTALPTGTTVYGIGQGNGAGTLALTPATACYLATCVYQVTSAIDATARVQFAIDWSDGNGTFLATTAVRGPYGQSVDQTWQTLSVKINGQGGMTPPAGVMYATLYAGVVNDGTPNANASGAFVIGQITFLPSTSQLDNPLYPTALDAGMYPTPYCDATQPGCYTDALFPTVAYRQLRLFGGYIRNTISDYTDTGGQETLMEIDGVDYGVTLQEAPATLIIPAQSDADAIKQAFIYAQDQGYLTDIDYTTFVTSIATINPIIVSWMTTRDVMTKIANMTVAFYYVDYYKRLHYGPALADSTAYNVSDTPDYVNTFPFSEFKFQTDSTQSLTDPVIEGSTQLSAAQTSLGNTWYGALGANLSNGQVVTSVARSAATTVTTYAGTVIRVDNGAGVTQDFIVTTTTVAGATSLPVQSVTMSAAFTSGMALYVVGFQVNSGSPIATVDSITVNSAGQTVGLQAGNQYTQGYEALFDPSDAIILWNGAIAAAPNTYPVVILFRYHLPVLVRLKHPVLLIGTPGKPRRRITQHIKLDEVTSIEAAIDRANAELRRRAQGQPAGQFVIYTPRWPQGVPILAGQAIQITHGPSHLTQALFQIQQVVTIPKGNGIVRREVQIGYYQADFMIQFAAAQRDLAQQGVNPISGQLITDALSVDDAWAMNDSAFATLQNVGQWGGSSTWGGSFVWG